jgi:hypothetical protein
MSRHTLVGHLGEIADDAVAAHGTDGHVTHVLLAAVDGRLEHGLANVLRDLNELGIPPTDIGIDLLLLATLVHAADTRVARSTESQDTWTRELQLVIPVSDPALWRPTATLLETMLSFLTGDRWQLGFVPRPDGFTIAIGGKKPEVARTFAQVNLFSGGLDSLIGAVDSLEDDLNPLFVSHASEGATSEAQTACFEGVEKQYSSVALARLRAWASFPEGLVKDVKSENTTRGRSFLFIALAVVAGSGLRRDFVLEVPENGLIALNVPLDLLRLGSLSTRTTHPFYLARWNELLARLGVPAVVRNSYWNRTKGEMVAQCRNAALLKRLVPSSMSCSSPTKGRWQGHGIEHCGYCVPCLIRRAAIEKAWGAGNDPTTYTLASLSAHPLDTRQAQGQQARSFQLGLARLKAKPGIERLLIHKPGSLRDEGAHLSELAAVYRRGMEEVGALLSSVTTKPS